MSNEEQALRQLRDDHIAQVTRTGTTHGVRMLGLPIVLLSYQGVKTGRTRRTPLMRVEADGRYALVASRGGSDTDPLWYRCVLAQPRVQIQDGSQAHEFISREVFHHERRDWWDHAVEAVPQFAVYQARTSRPIPLLVCDRVAGD